MKRAFAVLCLGALLATGCKSTSDRNATTTTRADTEMSTELGTGVTDDTIRIGVTYTDLKPLKDIGMKLDHGDYASAFQALADDVNANGGINGRKLELVQAPVNPIGTGAGTTVCTELTEDKKVFAVIGDLQQDIVPCYTNDHDTAVVGSYQAPASLAAAKAPWFTWYPSLDRLLDKTIVGAAADGAFKGKKVAVVSLPVDKAMVDANLDKALAEAGIADATKAVVDAPSDDAAAAAAAAQTIAERFKSDGVEVVITVGNAFSPFADGLTKTNYRPVIVTTDDNVVSAWKVAKSDDAMSVLGGLIAGGGVSRQEAWKQPAMQACVKKILAADPGRQITDPSTAKEGDPETYVSVLLACRSMGLFVAIADGAGTTLNNDTFRKAGHDLGSFQVPGVGGVSDFTATAPTGDPNVYLRRWDPATKDLTSDPNPIP